MFKPRIIFVIAVILQMHSASLMAQTKKAVNLYKQPLLDGITLAFAVNKLTNSSPDIQAYAENFQDYQRASVFDRDKIISQEKNRLQILFSTLNLATPYTLRISVEINQYDTQQKGYPLPIVEATYVPINEQRTSTRYGVAFINYDAVNFIPMDEREAQRFAKQFKLNTQYERAGSGILEVTARLKSVRPSPENGVTLVDAEIATAHLLTSSGQLMHDFGTLVKKEEVVSSDKPGLKADDVQGIEPGMMVAKAIEIASHGRAIKVGEEKDGTLLFFNGLQSPPDHGASCGDINSADSLQNTGNKDNLDFRDCIGLSLLPKTADKPANVDSVASQQKLQKIDVEAIETVLDKKYGAPTRTNADGTNRVWIGRSLSNPGEGEITVEAQIDQNSKILTVISRHSQATSPPGTASDSDPKL